MDKKSAKKSDSSEKESDDADRSSDPTQEEEATDSQSKEPDSPAGNVRKAGGSGAVQASAVGGTPSGQKAQSHSSGEGYVNYERGSDPGALSARYGMDVRDAEAGKLQRLEREFGSDRVNRWAEEGMTVETMGKPRDMQAFRTRQEERSEEIPTDIERRNEASLQRNASGEREDSPAGETGVPDVVRSVVSSSGRSMDETVQREMESKMGGDFSDVQLHTGPKAAAAADSINARAFTLGNHVAFNKGEYQPDSDSGKKVLAHELTHVRQQTEGAVTMLPKPNSEPVSVQRSVAEGVSLQPKLELSSPDDRAEKEAEVVAEHVVAMENGNATDQNGSEDGGDSEGVVSHAADSDSQEKLNVSGNNQSMHQNPNSHIQRQGGEEGDQKGSPREWTDRVDTFIAELNSFWNTLEIRIKSGIERFGREMFTESSVDTEPDVIGTILTETSKLAIDESTDYLSGNLPILNDIVENSVKGVSKELQKAKKASKTQKILKYIENFTNNIENLIDGVRDAVPKRDRLAKGLKKTENTKKNAETLEDIGEGLEEVVPKSIEIKDSMSFNYLQETNKMNIVDNVVKYDGGIFIHASVNADDPAADVEIHSRKLVCPGANNVIDMWRKSINNSDSDLSGRLDPYQLPVPFGIKITIKQSGQPQLVEDFVEIPANKRMPGLAGDPHGWIRDDGALDYKKLAAKVEEYEAVDGTYSAVMDPSAVKKRGRIQKIADKVRGSDRPSHLGGGSDEDQGASSKKESSSGSSGW
jgi:hypothetical protein